MCFKVHAWSCIKCNSSCWFSDGIDEEDDIIEILRDILHSQPARSHTNEHIKNVSEDATNQSNCSSGKECIDSNASGQESEGLGKLICVP